MKKLITIIVFITSFLNSNYSLLAQNTFTYLIKDSLSDELINAAIEIESGGYILINNQLSHPNKVHLISLSQSGVQLRSKVFDFQCQSSGFLNILQINPNTFVLAGYTVIDNKTNIWLYSMDSLFTEIRSKVFSLDTCAQYSIDILQDEDGNYLLYGLASDPSQHSYPYIYKVSDDFDSLQFKLYSDYRMILQPALLKKTDNSGYYFFLPLYTLEFTQAVLDLNNSFSINKISGVPLAFQSYPNAKWINKEAFILTSRKDFDPPPNDRCIGALVMDTNFSVKHEQYIGNHDTIEWPGIRKNLDFRYPNSIYIGGTHNFCQWDLCPILSWYSLTNLDSLLNVRWQKFYGGNANYTLWGLLATVDGGCLLYGTIYDTAIEVEGRNVYVVKVDSNGMLTGINDINYPLAHDVIVYPNPGSENLIVQSGLQISGATFQMKTMDGKEVFSKTLHSLKVSMNTQSLPSGVYIWYVTFNGRIVENGKWIKN